MYSLKEIFFANIVDEHSHWQPARQGWRATLEVISGLPGISWIGSLSLNQWCAIPIPWEKHRLDCACIPPGISAKTHGFLAQVGRLQKALLDRSKEAVQPQEGGMLFEDDIESDEDSGLEQLFPGLDI